MSADNAVASYLNGIEVGSTTYVYDVIPAERGDDVKHFLNLHGPYDLDPVQDINTLSFVVRNYYGSEDNPTALLYRAEITYNQEETAWGSGSYFNDKNWATYISYEVDCCFEVPGSDGITIDAYSQGTLKNGGDVLGNRSFPESIKTKYDNILSGESTGFFSLGFGGSIEFSFSCPVRDGEGDDLRIYETTGGTYPLEQADVYALSGGVWVKVGTVNNKTGTDQGQSIWLIVGCPRPPHLGSLTPLSRQTSIPDLMRRCLRCAICRSVVRRLLPMR